MLGQMEAAAQVVKGIAKADGTYDVNIGITILAEMLFNRQVKHGKPDRLADMSYCISYARDLIKNFRLQNHGYTQLGTAAISRLSSESESARVLRSLEAGKRKLQEWGMESPMVNNLIEEKRK